MMLQQRNGRPLQFNLLDAAALTGASVSTLRNNIAREIYHHLGAVPFAGQERSFAATGLAEVAIVDALSKSMPLKKAAEIADRILRQEYADALVDGRVSHILKDSIMLPKPTCVLSQELCPDTSILDANPHQWMKGPRWENQTASNPFLVVFFFDEEPGLKHLHFKTVKGWGQIESAAVELMRNAVPVVLPSVPWGGEATRMEDILPTAEVALSRYPHVHILNLTAIVAKIANAVERKSAATSISEERG